MVARLWAEDLLKQVNERAIPTFEAQLPGKQALVAFDNATGHLAFVPDALRATRLNLGPVGKFPIIRSPTWGDGNVQRMKFSKSSPKILLVAVNRRASKLFCSNEAGGGKVSG